MTADINNPTLTYTDPRTGKLLWRLTAQSGHLSTGKDIDSAIVIMHDADAVMYRNGIPADHLRASQVKADQAKRTVNADGNVVVSTIGPQPVTMRCDHLVWNVDRDTIVGTGNAVCRKGGFVQTMPSFMADTLMRTIVAPAPGLKYPPKAAIHTSISGSIRPHG
jgi:hypothetical protein